MSLAIWPPISPEELKIKEAAVLMLIDAKTGRKRRELEWMIDEVRDTLRDIKHGLEDCYALLAPIEPGSTLVMSTPRNEKVKGHVTRVGTQLVKGTIHIQLRTLPTQTLTLNAAHPITIAPLARINAALTECIDMLALTLDVHPPHAPFLSTQLRVLAGAISECSSLLKGPPLTESDPAWTASSVEATHFQPRLGSNLSFHIGIQESSLVLWLRALEPANVPLHFGTKLGLAIGTVRRLEHDEMDRVFEYTHVPSPTEELGAGNGSGSTVSKVEGWLGAKTGGLHGATHQAASAAAAVASAGVGVAEKGATVTTEVFVREKVRVESADPSLMSVSAKFLALNHTLLQARKNLAAVMGEKFEE